MRKKSDPFDFLKGAVDAVVPFFGMDPNKKDLTPPQLAPPPPARDDAAPPRAVTPPPAPPPAGAAANVAPPPAGAAGPPPAAGNFPSDPLGVLNAFTQGVQSATGGAIEFVRGIINPDTAKTGTDGDDKKTDNATGAGGGAKAGAAANTGAGGGAKAGAGGPPLAVSVSTGPGTIIITGAPVPLPLPLDLDEKRRQALYSRQFYYSEEEFSKLSKKHDFKPQRIQDLSVGEDDYGETRLFREISSSSSKDPAKSNEYKPLEVDKFLEHMSVYPFISRGAIEPEGSATKKRENEKDIVAKISKMSLGYEDDSASSSKAEKTIEIGNCKINSLRIIDIYDIKTDTKIFISNKGLKELEDYRIELGEKIHEFVKKYSNDKVSPTFKFSSDKNERETQIQYLFDNVESIKKIQKAIENPQELYDEASKKAKGDNSKEEIIKSFKAQPQVPAPAAGAAPPPAPGAAAPPAAGAGAAVVAGAPPVAVAGVAVVAGAAVTPAPAPVAGATLSKEDEMKLVNKIADTILQKRLVKGKIGVEKKEDTSAEYKESDISSVRISRPKDDPKKIDIEAKGDFDATDLQYVNVCLDSKKGHYVQFQLKGDGNKGKAVLVDDDPKYFTKIGNVFEKKEGEKASEIKKTLSKHKINIITTNTPDTSNTPNNNAKKTLTEIRLKSRAFGGFRGVDPKRIPRTMIKSDKVFVLGEDNSIKIGESNSSNGKVDIKLVKKDGKFLLEYEEKNKIGTKTGGWLYDREIKKVEVDLDGKSLSEDVNLKTHSAIPSVNPFATSRKLKSQDNLRLKVFDGKNNEYFELEIKRVGNNYILGGGNNEIKIVGKTTGMPKTIDASGAVDEGSKTPTSNPKGAFISSITSCLGKGR